MYHAEPDGIAGNEDVGQMSAWFLLSALGFYAVDPVSGNYIVGSPEIESAVVQIEEKQLRIEVKNNSPENVYVQSFTLNGTPQQRLWFNHKEIADGGHIVLEMGPQPNMKLGNEDASIPPSMGLPHS
jgi:putative alpha-1,2-mannosidase